MGQIMQLIDYIKIQGLSSCTHWYLGRVLENWKAEHGEHQ